MDEENKEVTGSDKVRDFWKNPENIIRLLDFLFLGREEGNEIPS